MEARRPYLNARLQGFGTTVFAEMSALAVRMDAINLGQGFPDEDGPAEITEAAVEAIRNGRNQYPPGAGKPELRVAIAAHQRRFYGLEHDPDTEVLVTAGATEAITAAVLALCEVGDEVVVFEPWYDSYGAAIAMAGAQRRAVPLRPPDWSFDPKDLARAFGPRTRLLLLNSPHNPTGKVFGDEEMAEIARQCIEHDVLVVTDEVYEHLIFEGRHVPMATLPDMGERTVTVSSAGKTFSFTGWKIGWACGPPELVSAVRTAKQFLTYVSGAPFQDAIAAGLGLDDSFFRGIAEDLRAKRDRLCAGLANLGFDVLVPAGTYFATADVRPLGVDDGTAFCWELPERYGVAAVPSAAFFEDPARARHLVRFAFCKRPEVLDEALRRLSKLA